MKNLLRNKNTPLVDILKLAATANGKIPATIPAHYVKWALAEHRHNRRPRDLVESSCMAEIVPMVIRLNDMSKRVLIQHGSSNWDLFLAADGVKLMAVAKPDSGCKSSPYGDKYHLLRLMNAYPHQSQFVGYTEAGLQYMSGLFCGITSRYLAFSSDI